MRANGFKETTVPTTASVRGEISVRLVRTTDQAELSFQQAETARETAKNEEDRQKAVGLYRDALKARAAFPAAHVGLARVLLDLNDTDGALQEIGNLLNRAVQLASESATGTVDDTGRTALDNELTAIKAEIGRIAADTKYNGQELFSSTLGLKGVLSVFVGDISSTSTISVNFVAIESGAIGGVSYSGAAVDTAAHATTALGTLSNAIAAADTIWMRIALSPRFTLPEFLERRGEGIHHLALEVDDIEAALAELRRGGLEVISDGPQSGMGGSRVAFVHPRSFGGVLLELRQAPKSG